MKGFLLTLLYHLILQYLFTVVVCLVIFSETNRLDQTLCFQLWEKGFFKDNLLGSAWIPLMQIHHSNEGGSGAWVQLSNETSKGLVSSGHLILVDSRFELPSGMSQQKKAWVQANSCLKFVKIMVKFLASYIPYLKK